MKKIPAPAPPLDIVAKALKDPNLLDDDGDRRIARKLIEARTAAIDVENRLKAARAEAAQCEETLKDLIGRQRGFMDLLQTNEREREEEAAAAVREREEAEAAAEAERVAAEQAAATAAEVERVVDDAPKMADVQIDWPTPTPTA